MFPLTQFTLLGNFMAINSLAYFNIFIHSSLVIHSIFFLVLSGLWYHGHCCPFIRSLQLLCKLCGECIRSTKTFAINYIVIF